MLSSLAPKLLAPLGLSFARAAAPAVSQALATRSVHHPPHRQTHEEVTEYLSNLFNLENKVAFVTGAAGAVGKPLCLGLARAGADVVASDVPSQLPNLEKLAGQVRALGRECLTVAADVTEVASVHNAMREADKQFGRLDILVSNAGILGDNVLPQDMSEENWQRVFAINLDGPFHVARAAYPLLKKSKNGKVVIMSSIAGQHGYGPQSAYCSSKGALVPLAKSLALAWAPDRINVNCVLPGAANTPFTTKVLGSKEKVRRGGGVNMQQPLWTGSIRGLAQAVS
mmetsp:Transcript_12922/g.31680  ORF Transcript_12922/g.31680 Transcript_12922/m.31680 type:complete len:284 (-) Transcript_12922:23-874(-)